MSDRQRTISRLTRDQEFRADYIRAKLDVLIPSQLRALRLKEGLKQSETAELVGMKQARISAMETPGLVNFNRETLVRMAALHGVGLIVEFASFSEMLEWENSYSQDSFDVIRLNQDREFLHGTGTHKRRKRRAKRIVLTAPCDKATASGQLNLFIPTPPKVVVPIRIDKQTNSGQTAAWNALGMTGGMPDGRQKYPASA